MSYDDRKGSIDEYIASYERTWNTFAGIISRVNLTDDDGFGEGLKNFAKSDLAKTEFLLRSFPPFYSNTIENIKSKEPTYDDAVRKLREYIPMRQKGKKGKGESAENPVVLKADRKPVKDNGKRCSYCIGKGWKGLNHEESECYTKKREEKSKSRKEKKEDESEEDDGVLIHHIRVKLIGANHCEGMEMFQYDTGTTHHSTNQLNLLSDVQDVKIKVEAHDGTISYCRKLGVMIFTHLRVKIKYYHTLYDPHSNLISGQRLGKHTLEVNEEEAILTKDGKRLYVMNVDTRGGMWIQPDPVKIAKTTSDQELVKELHERQGNQTTSKTERPAYKDIKTT